MGFIRDWLRKRDEARLKKLAAAKVAEDRAAADKVVGNPLYALEETGEVTAQYQGALADLEEAKQAKTEAVSSAKRVQAMAERIVDKDPK